MRAVLWPRQREDSPSAHSPTGHLLGAPSRHLLCAEACADLLETTAHLLAQWASPCQPSCHLFPPRNNK